MKRLSIISAFSAVLCSLLSSCGNMQVATDVIKMYPMTCYIPDVKVYEGSKSPENYEHLGTVAVYDQGMTRVTSYEATLDMAKRAVCETGGNALYIARHEIPNSLVSVNHQIIGQILLEKDGKSDVKQSPAGDLPVKKELPDYVGERYRIPDGPQVVNGNNIYFNGGYGRLFNKIEGEEVEPEQGSIQNGFAYNFGYEHILPDGHWGIGAFCSNYTSAMDAKRKMELLVQLDSTSTERTKVYRKFAGKERIGLHAFGPSVSYSNTNDHLFLSARAGLGIAWMSESFAFRDLVYGAGIDTDSGIMKLPYSYGAALQLSGEIGYRINSLFTIGVTLGASEYGIVFTDANTKQFGIASTAFICPTFRITL